MPKRVRKWSVERLQPRLAMPDGPDGCHLWTGALRNGYGKISWNGRTLSTHRLTWELVFGPIPDGMNVLHRCDNPACCNPRHLFLGNHADNMRDREAKDRHNAPIGSRHGRATLTDDQVREIRRLWSHGVPQTEIAKRLGTNPQRVYSIVHRRTWRHID